MEGRAEQCSVGKPKAESPFDGAYDFVIEVELHAIWDASTRHRTVIEVALRRHCLLTTASEAETQNRNQQEPRWAHTKHHTLFVAKESSPISRADADSSRRRGTHRSGLDFCGSFHHAAFEQHLLARLCGSSGSRRYRIRPIALKYLGMSIDDSILCTRSPVAFLARSSDW